MSVKVERSFYHNELESSLRNFPVTILSGPRQVGKTTLARQFTKHQAIEVHWFDLEKPSDYARLQNPQLALEPLQGIVVIDEVQRFPELFPLLRVLADRNPLPARFIILGSASGDLLRQSSETLAGRVKSIELPGFQLNELCPEDLNQHLTQGGFPRSFLADAQSSFEWREQFIQTFLEKDLSVMGVRTPSNTLRRVWTMLAHYHGQVVNFSELGRSLQISDNSIRNYIDLFCDSFMIRLLLPWFENMGKRLVKSPKLYIRDAGIANCLLGIKNLASLQGHPKLGAIWEGYAMEQVITQKKASRNSYFWATHAGAELDLLIIENGRRLGYEFKYSDSPGITRSIRQTIKDLALDEVTVVYPGSASYPLDRNIQVKPLHDPSL